MCNRNAYVHLFKLQDQNYIKSSKWDPYYCKQQRKYMWGCYIPTTVCSSMIVWVTIFTPCTFARQGSKAVLSVIIKIARSQVLNICACCNYHKLVDIGEKLACVLWIAEHGSLALQIVYFPFSLPAVNRLDPLHVLTWLLCMLDRPRCR